MTEKIKMRRAAFLPLHWTDWLVRPSCTRARWKIQPVQRHNRRAPACEWLLLAFPILLLILPTGCHAPAKAPEPLQVQSTQEEVIFPSNSPQLSAFTTQPVAVQAGGPV